MIYLTTFILTLFLTHIACALPQACHDPITPELSTPDPYGDAQYDLPIPARWPVTYDKKYDDRYGLTKTVVCAYGKYGLNKRYPRFGDFPTFPRIGGAFDVSEDSINCGGCWKLTN